MPLLFLVYSPLLVPLTAAPVADAVLVSQLACLCLRFRLSLGRLPVSAGYPTLLFAFSSPRVAQRHVMPQPTPTTTAEPSATEVNRYMSHGLMDSREATRHNGYRLSSGVCGIELLSIHSISSYPNLSRFFKT